VILVDTGVWIDHLRRRDQVLSGLLERGGVLGHPWVTGELALGNLQPREEMLHLMGQLPQATVASPAEIMDFIERHQLAGAGVGYVDAQLLAATRLTDGARIWTRDRRLREAAERVGVAFDDSSTAGSTRPAGPPAGSTRPAGP
jgi:predicted nucleic acid-binding protein